MSDEITAPDATRLAEAADVPAVKAVTDAVYQKIYPKFGYEFVERRIEGVYDRFHYRKRLPERG